MQRLSLKQDEKLKLPDITSELEVFKEEVKLSNYLIDNDRK